MSELVLAYLHSLGVGLLFAALFAELLLFRPDLGLAEHARVVRVDLGFGAAAALVLVTGVARVFLSGKGTAFYFDNLSFHALGTVFLVAALLSFYPTRQFMRRRQALRAGNTAPLSGRVTRRIQRILWTELLLLLLALWLAVLMARGIGISLGIKG